MTMNEDFHSVEFFRKVRDEHASLLRGKRQEEIIAFFYDQKVPNKRLQPTAQSAGRSAPGTLGGG